MFLFLPVDILKRESLSIYVNEGGNAITKMLEKVSNLLDLKATKCYFWEVVLKKFNKNKYMFLIFLNIIIF